MDAERFYKAVRLCVEQGEFAEQSYLLDVIEPEHRLYFIQCLVRGIPFRKCFGVLEEFLTTKRLVEEEYKKEGLNPNNPS